MGEEVHVEASMVEEVLQAKVNAGMTVPMAVAAVTVQTVVVSRGALERLEEAGASECSATDLAFLEHKQILDSHSTCRQRRHLPTQWSQRTDDSSVGREAACR